MLIALCVMFGGKALLVGVKVHMWNTTDKGKPDQRLYSFYSALLGFIVFAISLATFLGFS
jgi:hypothetical protein